MTCPCGRVEQPSPTATRCYDCALPIPKLPPLVTRKWDDAVQDWHEASMAQTCAPSPKAAEPNAAVHALSTLFDAMFIQYHSKPKRVRMGYRLFADYREATGAHVAIGQSSFDFADIRFVYDQELGPFGVEIEHG